MLLQSNKVQTIVDRLNRSYKGNAYVRDIYLHEERGIESVGVSLTSCAHVDLRKSIQQVCDEAGVELKISYIWRV